MNALASLLSEACQVEIEMKENTAITLVNRDVSLSHKIEFFGTVLDALEGCHEFQDVLYLALKKHAWRAILGMEPEEDDEEEVFGFWVSFSVFSLAAKGAEKAKVEMEKATHEKEARKVAEKGASWS